MLQADYLAQFAGLESGDLHVAMEMWETTRPRGHGRRHWPPARSRNFWPAPAMKAKEEVVVPFLHDWRICPGLPNWEALKDEAVRRGLSSRDRAKGRILAAP